MASDHTTADIPATPAICPLSQGQRALWFLQQLNPESAAYNIARAGTIRGDLNVSAFQSAWQRLTDRHASLRSTFSLRDGEPVRVIHAHMPVAFEALDASDWSPTAVSEYLSREAAVPFDLTRGPLMRVKILKRSREEHKGLAVWHHTVTDLWSLGIMLYEMDAIYGAETAGVSAPLPPLTVDYAHYVREQAETLAGPDGERLWSFWHGQLAGAPQVLDLPTDRPRPAIQSWQGSSVVRRLPVGLATQLRRVAAETRTTLHALSLSAFAALVHRYTSQDDFLIGTPRAGRSRKHFPVVGYFVNPIVIRIDASGNPSFAEFLQRVGQAMVGAREHQAFPFIRIVEQLHLQRDLSRSPMYQVGFAWQKGSTLDPTGFTSFALHESGGAMTIGGLAWEFLDLERQVVPIDINLLMVEDGEELAVSAEYATELFDRTTIERMVEHFETLLKAVIDDPGTRLASLPLMTEEERDRILVAWSGTVSKKPPASLVHESFEATVAESGETLALALGEKQLRYSELNSRSNQLARELRDRGVGRNVPVALCLNRSWEMVVGLLGVLKAGGVYLPLDPAYPTERNRVIIDDARPSVVLTQGEVASALSEPATRVICLDSDWQAIARHDDSDLGLAIDGGSAAYIIYTSGSTGRPKGTVISHAALADHCREMSAHFQIRSDDRVLQFASLCFDASLEQILTTLCGGATLLPRGGDLWQPAQFHEWLAEHAVTVVNIPPAYWHQWVEAYVEARVWTRLDQLRLVIVGGDVMRPETVRMWCDTPLASVRLLNAYGPTEATVTATTYEVRPERDAYRARIPIGRPLSNRRLYILDGFGSPVPVGVPGELCLGGAGLALYYLNRPELTLAKFGPDPFSGDPGARLYRTGDRARFLPDGTVEPLGRIDLQLKVRGFRIEPEEIESVLCEHARVAAAAVTTVPDERGDARLVAYLVLVEGTDLGSDELREYLASRFPDYMVPAFYVPVDDLPLGPGGKVDRRALTEIESARLTLQRPFVAPRDLIEAKIAAMWSEVLGIDGVGVHDDFFDLGGHSLLATQLVSRIRGEFHVEVPLRELWEAPTVARLSLLVTQSLAEQEDEQALAELLDEIGQLSDREVQTLLSDEVREVP